MPPIASASRMYSSLLIVLGAGACLIGSVIVADAGKRAGDGLAAARVLTSAERALLESKVPADVTEWLYQNMSAMGAAAAGIRRPADPDFHPSFHLERMAQRFAVGGTDVSVVSLPAVATQSETSIASNSAGTILVAGYNDTRGFPDPSNPDQVTLSLSGLTLSTNGGATWSPVPVGPGGSSTLPTVTNGSVYGDPDVTFDPTRNVFFYSSIYVRPSDGRQGVCVHVSNTAGTSWTGPREVTPSFISGQSGDKPFMDINPNTGRIIVTWTSFGVTMARILSTFSDDGGLTWSAAAQLVSVPIGSLVQASEPRFLPGATNAASTVYVVWSNGTSTTRNIAMVRSLDGGATWGSTVNVDASSFTAEDQILGVDRVNSSPSMAIDYSTGRVYVVYQANNSQGEGDVALRTFIGAPAAGSRVLIDSNPGSDRAQFLTAVAVDQSTHRAHVIWYDQDPKPSWDLTELMHTYSTDGGTTWSRPTPLFDRPFRAGVGNDTGQPNLGDYNRCVATNGVLQSLAANTNEISQFNEGLPARSLYSPDPYFDALSESQNIASLRLGAATFTEACASGVNGFLDPGETGLFTFPLENYVNNPMDSPTTYTNVSATLSSSTPGVTISGGSQSYGSIAPLAMVSNGAPFQVQLSTGFTPGDYVHLLLTVNSDQGSIQLSYLLATGSPVSSTTLINEDFQSVTVPALPAGWSAQVGAGTSGPWVTSQTSFGGNATKYAFHGEGTATEWMRLWSPVVTVPNLGPETYVTLDFDLAYNTQIDPTKLIQAFDGLTLRITDVTGVTPTTALRSVLVEAFAERITTGTSEGFPKHLPRSSNTSYFEDMSVWAGNSGNVPVHVSMKFPGAGMVGRDVQLRFEYTQDGSGVCSSGTCGVGIDNVVLKAVTPGAQFVASSTSTTVTSDHNPWPAGQPLNLMATVTPSTTMGSVEFFDGGTSLGTASVVSGSATFNTSSLTQGTHDITGSYSGDACDLASTSGIYSQVIDSPVGVANPATPLAYAIERVVPNPATKKAAVTFALPHEGHVALGVYDLHGRLVHQIASSSFRAGEYTLVWDLAGGNGKAAGAGVYFVRLSAGGLNRTARFTIVP